MAIDTNHLERALRPIPMGRKSWLFCGTEVGSEKVGRVQSQIATCMLPDIDSYVYLVDVLQRVDTHMLERVEELTPRRWKKIFLVSEVFLDMINFEVRRVDFSCGKGEI